MGDETRASRCAARRNHGGRVDRRRQQAGTKHSDRLARRSRSRTRRADLDVRVQPVQRHVRSLSFGPVYEELVFVNELKSGADDSVARVEVCVVEPQQDAHVHDPFRSEVVGRQAAHGGRRLLHVPAAEEAPGARSPGRLVGPEERDSQGQQGRLQLQDRGSAVLLLRRRPDTDRAAASLGRSRIRSRTRTPTRWAAGRTR